MAGNGRSGRRRKPTAQHKVEGTYRPHRHGGKEFEATGEPNKPRGLDKHAKSLWDAVVPHLTSSGVAKEIDTALLQILCEVWSLYRRSLDIANRDPINRDARIAVTQYAQRIESIAARFGLNPSDRAKFQMPEGTKGTGGPLGEFGIVG